MKLKVCKNHSPAHYTLAERCSKCNKETGDAHYKFAKLPNAERDISPLR